MALSMSIMNEIKRGNLICVGCGDQFFVSVVKSVHPLGIFIEVRDTINYTRKIPMPHMKYIMAGDINFVKIFNAAEIFQAFQGIEKDGGWRRMGLKFEPTEESFRTNRIHPAFKKLNESGSSEIEPDFFESSSQCSGNGDPPQLKNDFPWNWGSKSHSGKKRLLPKLYYPNDSDDETVIEETSNTGTQKFKDNLPSHCKQISPKGSSVDSRDLVNGVKDDSSPSANNEAGETIESGDSFTNWSEILKEVFHRRLGRFASDPLNFQGEKPYSDDEGVFAYELSDIEAVVGNRESPSGTKPKPIESIFLKSDEIEHLESVSKNIVYIKQCDHKYFKAVADLNSRDMISVFVAPNYARHRPSSVLVLGTLTTCYIYDLKCLGKILKEIKELLEATRPIKVVHHGHTLGDYLKVREGIKIAGVFDTFVAYCILTRAKHDIRLEDLLRKLFKLTPNTFHWEEHIPLDTILSFRPIAEHTMHHLSKLAIYMLKLYDFLLHGVILDRFYDQCDKFAQHFANNPSFADTAGQMIRSREAGFENIKEQSDVFSDLVEKLKFFSIVNDGDDEDATPTPSNHQIKFEFF